MSATPFATTDDVANLFGDLTAAQEQSATAQIAFASAIIRNEIVDVDARIAAGTLDPTLVLGVCVAMVVRYLNNPKGIRATQEAIEDYSTQQTVDSTQSTGALYLSADECDMLTSKKRRAFSIKPQGEPATFDTLQKVARRRVIRDVELVPPRPFPQSDGTWPCP